MRNEHHKLKVPNIRDSIVVSISACHAADPGSIPGRGICFAPAAKAWPLTSQAKKTPRMNNLQMRCANADGSRGRRIFVHILMGTILFH